MVDQTQAPAPAPAPAPSPAPSPTPAPSLTAETPAETPKPAETPSILGDKPSDSVLGEQVDKPIVYEDFKVPEGFELDPEALGPVKTLFSELKLDQAGAQRLIDSFAANAAVLQKSIVEEAQQEWVDLRGEWTKAIEDDPDIGGAKLPQVRADISRVFDRYGTPGLREALKLTGADNNPEIVKTFAKIASVLTEGKHLTGDTPKPAPKTAAQALYPTGPNSQMMGRPEAT
jgi:hypothetical protein